MLYKHKKIFFNWGYSFIQWYIQYILLTYLLWVVIFQVALSWKKYFWIKILSGKLICGFNFSVTNFNSNSKFIDSNSFFLNKQFQNWIDPMSAVDSTILKPDTDLMLLKSVVTTCLYNWVITTVTIRNALESYSLGGSTWDPVQTLRFQSSLGKAKKEYYSWILLTKLLIWMPSSQCCVPSVPSRLPKEIQCMGVLWAFCCNRLPYRNYTLWVIFQYSLVGI